MGIGDWGLGIGPNPQSPIPNPQSNYKIVKFFTLNIIHITYKSCKLNKMF
jgi:hypothetical protein